MDPVISLASLPATPQQRRFVLALAVVFFVAFLISAPFATLSLRRFDAFIPSLEAIIFVNDFITSVLLYTQYAIIQSRAILALASGYLFTALIVVPHALTFPGAFAPTGLLGAGLQSTAWLYFFWHIGSPAAVLLYAYLKVANRPHTVIQRSTAPAIGCSAVIVITLVCGLTWTATAGDRFLPALFSDSINHIRSTLDISIPLILLVGVFAIALLWARRRSVLDYWLMLVVWALILEQVLIALLSNARFSLGFYAGRGFALVTSIIVLVVLLAETTKLYARLARSNQQLERERDNKLINAEAIAASIAHEVKQPLAAIVTSGHAALRFLEKVPLDLQMLRGILNTMTNESFRASEVFDSIRGLFTKANQQRQTTDLNEITLEAIKSLHDELKNHGVTARTKLTTALPPVEGHRNQLRQVMINLVLNALEAMDNTTDQSRALLVETELYGRDAIAVAVVDSGPGIDPNQLNGIFDVFVTTKSHGTGLGLAICRTIIERHGGQISAFSDGKNGATFRFILPIEPKDATIVHTN
jgi:signal transduction histidine kinase